MNNFPAADVVAFIMEREVLRILARLSQGDRRFLRQFAFALWRMQDGRRGGEDRPAAVIPDDPNEAIAGLLPTLTASDVYLVYRQARILEERKTPPGRE